MTNRDINHILARINKDKANAFDTEYADGLYQEYINNVIEDSDARSRLKKKLANKKILILAPGKSLNTEREVINKYVSEDGVLVISVNFVSEFANSYAFFSNARRIEQAIFRTDCEVIGTSNLEQDRLDYVIDHKK